MTCVLVLGGGPDGEREVSLASARAVAGALAVAGTHGVELREIERVDRAALRAMPGEVVFPVLHGPWGEGGSLQEFLEADGRPYVGSGPAAARHAMDKLRTLRAVVEVGGKTAGHAELSTPMDASPVGLPCVLKPIDDGSSVGLAVVRSEEEWGREMRARWAAGRPSRRWMCERYVQGREMTVAVLGGRTLPLIEILPAAGLYDYAAKYDREDTRYVVDPRVPPATRGEMERVSLSLCDRIGVRHLARVDFMVDSADQPMVLEVNTMPGFTAHSLFPMAARRAGLDMPALCESLVQMAMNGERSMAGAGA